MPTKMRATTLALTLAVLAGTVALADENHQESIFDALAQHYLTIQTALADDSVDGIAASATSISESAAALQTDFDIQQAGIDEADAGTLSKLLPKLQAAAAALAISWRTAESVSAAAQTCARCIAPSNLALDLSV